MHLSQAIFHTQPQTDKQDRALLINLTTFKAQDKRIIQDLCKLAWDVAKTLAPRVRKARVLRREENFYQYNSLAPCRRSLGEKYFFFQGIKVFFQYFPEFLFSLRFDPLATTLLRSYQRHRRVTRLHTNNLKREAGKQQPGSVAWVSRLTGRHPSASDAGGGGLCLFCRWWMEEEGIIRKSTTQAGMVWRLCRSAALIHGTGAALF